MMTGIGRLVVLLLVVGLLAAACADETATTLETAAASSSTPTLTSPDVLPGFSLGSTEPGTRQAYTFTSESGGGNIEYLLYLPENYQDDRDWPLIVSLHGFLGSDQSLNSVRTKNPLEWADPNAEFPFVLVAPKAPDGPWSLVHEPMTDLFDVLSGPCRSTGTHSSSPG
jgi:poly(3-hydroxybutyrate) depolymerase